MPLTSTEGESSEGSVGGAPSLAALYKPYNYGERGRMRDQSEKQGGLHLVLLVFGHDSLRIEKRFPGLECFDEDLRDISLRETREVLRTGMQRG
jgi:hypothetical protein